MAEFLQLVNSDPNLPAVGNYLNVIFYLLKNIFLGLGYFSEQSMESMHHDVKVGFYFFILL